MKLESLKSEKFKKFEISNGINSIRGGIESTGGGKGTFGTEGNGCKFTYKSDTVNGGTKYYHGSAGTDVAW